MSNNQGPFGVADGTPREPVGIGYGAERVGVGDASGFNGDRPGVAPANGQKPSIAKQFSRKALAVLLTAVIGAGGLYEANRLHKGEGLGLPSLPSISLTSIFNHHAKNVPPALQAYVNDPADASDVRDLKNDIAQTPYGLALLQFAKDNHITFAFDKKVGNILSEYNPAKSQILLNTGMKSEANVLYAIESLRFAWQDKVLHTSAVEATALTLDQRWALLRIKTADAQAFTAYVEADRIKKGIADERGLASTINNLHDGKSLAEQTAATTVAQICGIAEKLSDGGQGANGGLTYNDYLRNAFVPLLKQPNANFAMMLFDLGTHSVSFSRSVAAAGTDPAKLAALEGAVRATPNDAAFQKLLQQMGGLSLRPDGITSLQGIAPHRVTDELPWAGAPSNIVSDSKHAFTVMNAEQQRALAQLHAASQRANAPRAGS